LVASQGAAASGPGIEVALLVLAISAGAPLVPRKLIPLDNDA
jgi:hypothetical protein